MTEENHDKPLASQSFPDTTPEIAEMLNIAPKPTAIPTGFHSETPANLPVIDAEPVHDTASEDDEEVFDPTDITVPADQEAARPINDNPNGSQARAMRVLKAAAPYIGIFIVGLFLYQYFFSGFSVAQFFKNDASKVVTSQSETNERLEALKKDQAVAYGNWIRQFFYAVNDPSIIDMDNDLSGNGLTNFEKYLLNLNPKAYDTLGLGQPDGQTVMDGINPWTGKALSDNQRQIVELYFDRQIISNRLAAGTLKRSQGGIASGNSFTDGEGASISTNPQVAGAYTNQPHQALTGNATTTGEGNSLRSLDINEDIPGQLSIPANKINVPLIFTKDTANFDKDLNKGVVHYPGTPLPGEVGTSYISGHSSGYAWSKNPYKNVFRGLGNVKDGTSFTITVTLHDGRKATINYVVQGRQEFAANDQAQFIQTAEARVALSTCWPVDTSSRRLVLFAKQTQVSF
jgi:LPXTG-site transpeptidase (sortase) family protein